MKDLKQHYHVKVDQELKADCMVWWHFLKRPDAYSRPFMDFTNKLSAVEINFYTDASGAEDKGFGCVFDRSWTFGVWEQGFIKQFRPSIEYLELFGVATAIELWANWLENRRVVIFCDNKSVVDMLNQAAIALARSACN